MKDMAFISVWIKRFLLEYLVTTRNLSRNTQLSYRDTFRLLLPFAATKLRKTADKLTLEDVDTGTVRAFLTDLETERGCSVATRNQRLSAIHAFGRFVGMHSPEHLEWCRQLQQVPLKRSGHKLVTYLEKTEMDALLGAPDRKGRQGQRDYALLLFLYNTGARADEAAQLKIADLTLPDNPRKQLASVLIKGKGNKQRRCPLWQQTIDELKDIIGWRDPSQHVFINRTGQPITRFGIHTMVKRYAARIKMGNRHVDGKRISPHVIRHTTATHLLQSGVDINTIRAWLGHVSINTTNVYAEVDMEMKKRALACCEIKPTKAPTHWKNDRDIMAFLENL